MDSPEKSEQSITENGDELKHRKRSLKQFFFGWMKDNYDKAFLFVLVVALIIRFWIFTKTYDQALWWDAADYMSAAKRWAGVNPHMIDIWYYRRGFLWPLLGMVSFMIGAGEIGMRLLVVLISTGMVAVSYFLIAEMFNKKLGLLTSIGITLSWIFLFFSGRLLTNLPSAFFLLTAVLFFWKGFMKNQGKKYFILFGIFAGLAVLTRMQDLMFVFPILFLGVIKEKHKIFAHKGLWISIGIFVIVLLPQLYIHNAHFGNPLLDLTNYYLGIEGISQTGEVGVELAQFSDLFLYFNNLPYILDGTYLDAANNGYSNLFVAPWKYPLFSLFVLGSILFFIDLFLGIDKIFSDEKIQVRAFVFVWLVTTFLFLGYIAPQLEQRYITQTLPFLFFVAAYSSVFFESLLKNVLNQKAFWLIAFVFVLLLIPNFVFGDALIESKKSSYQEIKMAGLWIKEHSNESDIIVGGSLPQLTYYSERSVYPFELSYRREMKKTGEVELDKFVLEKKPRYYSISVIERDEDWAYAYPQKHQDMLTPVQVYQQGDQPILVIYEFKYLDTATAPISNNSRVISQNNT
ncbi:MAG: glycosyltransferase family 39 protein [Nanoarchaeota archaeon]